MELQLNGMIRSMVSEENALGDALMTGLILLVVVFAALIVLSTLIWLFGRSGRQQKKNPLSDASGTPASAPQPPRTVPQSVPATRSADNGEDDGAVMAVIAAAVAMMAPAGVSYQVKKITPSKRRVGRPVWAAAAISQNTSPF